jgi:hypothetical protein
MFEALTLYSAFSPVIVKSAIPVACELVGGTSSCPERVATNFCSCATTEFVNQDVIPTIANAALIANIDPFILIDIVFLLLHFIVFNEITNFSNMYQTLACSYLHHYIV